MKEIKTEIEITAPVEKVWQVLTDFEQFPNWNPFMHSAKGKIKVGERLEVYLKPPGRKGMTFKPRVRKVEQKKEFRWLGHLLIPGLFDGEHIFKIEPINGNRVKFIQQEIFKGILVPLLWKQLNTSTRKGFVEMNQALKNRAEQ